MENATMMTGPEIVSLYEAMVGICDQMLAAAAESDWSRLTQLEHQCAACVRQLKMNGDGQQPMAGTERLRKVNAIRKMLAADRQIRDLTQPWMNKLQAMIANKGVERRVARAYGI
jgi:flagellar protein FliT